MGGNVEVAHAVPSEIGRWAAPSLFGVALLLGALFFFPGDDDASGVNDTSAQADCQPQFGSRQDYDNGQRTSVAAHRAGLVVEFHTASSYGIGEIWYKIGKFAGTSVTWGGSQRAVAVGQWPTVAISKEDTLFSFIPPPSLKMDPTCIIASGGSTLTEARINPSSG